MGEKIVQGISTENLVKIYRKRRVVDNISLEINKGEVVGLLGPNGAGKTTTFYIIAVSYTHLRAHETRHDLVCRLLLEKKKKKQTNDALVSQTTTAKIKQPYTKT